MFSEGDWYDVDADESTEDAMLTMPLYDEDGNEIPDEKLPWSNASDENDDADAEDTWSENIAADDDVSACPTARPASERRKRIAESVRAEALRRFELSARTTAEFQELVNWYDREDESRMRRERRYETLRGDIPLETGMTQDGHIFPHGMSQPTFRQICRGDFDDYLHTCLFTMHDLTDRAHLREIIRDLKLDHKEILFFLGIRLYPTQRLADLRGQTERNIRKVRDTVQRRIQRKLYAALMDMQQSGNELIHLEQDFLRTYTPSKRRHDSNEESV